MGMLLSSLSSDRGVHFLVRPAVLSGNLNISKILGSPRSCKLA